jgi:Na+/melibiose symporter-like transporter
MVIFAIWRFPKIGGTPVLIHSIFGFSLLLVASQETSKKPSGGKKHTSQAEKKTKQSFDAVFLLKNLRFLQGFSIAMFDQQRI